MTSAMWSSWVEINPATAAKLGIGDGDVVEVASDQGSLQTAAVLSPGIAPDIVAMPAGQGHSMFTRYASGRGANPVDVLSPMTVDRVGSLAWAATRVRVSRVSGPDGRLILFAGGMREHENTGDDSRQAQRKVTKPRKSTNRKSWQLDFVIFVDFVR